nr:hypothetical protein [Tanacetum cinerariifolium]
MVHGKDVAHTTTRGSDRDSDEQQDFLADALEHFDSDCEELQLNATSILITEKLSLPGLINRDDVGLSYDSEFLSEDVEGPLCSMINKRAIYNAMLFDNNTVADMVRDGVINDLVQMNNNNAIRGILRRIVVAAPVYYVCAADEISKNMLSSYDCLVNIMIVRKALNVDQDNCLESAKARLVVYKKNEVVFEDDIKILKFDVMLRDKAITELRQKFEKAKKERDDLKFTLEKFKGSSKNLCRLLDSRQSDKSKTGLGYDSQGVDTQVLENQVNEKYNSCEGYHVVPPPYTGNFMPPKPDLVFTDEHVVSESITSLPDDEEEDVSQPKIEKKTAKPSFVKINFIKANKTHKTARKTIEQIRALFDGKRIIVNEASIKRDLRLDDAEGTACLPNAAIFEELARMSAKTTPWNEFSSTMASTIICLANKQKFNFSKYILDNMVKNLEAGVKFYMFLRFVQVFINHQLGDMSHHKKIFVIPSLTKKVFANMKRVGTGFSRAITPLFETMMVQAPEEVGEIPTDTQDTPILTQPSSFQPQRKHKSRMKHRKETEVSQDEPPTKKHIPTPSHDPLPSGKKKKKRTHGLKRMYNVGLSARIVSSDEEGLGDQEDASKHGRIAEIDVAVDVSAGEKEEHSEKVAEREVSTAGEVVTTIDVEVSAALTTTTTTDDELTPAQTLIEIKAAKPKAITTAAITVTAVSTRPKEKGIIMQEPSKTPSPKLIVSSQQPSLPKDKGKAKMVEPERPLKRKEQIMMNEQIARDIKAQMQANLEEEQRIAKQKGEEATRAMIVEWDNTQAMMDADYELAAKLQEEERGELSSKEKSKLFVGLMNKRKKHFERLRAEERRRKPPTKSQKRNHMRTYLKNMARFTRNQFKSKSFKEVQQAFNKTMDWINNFVAMDSEEVEGGNGY